MTRCEWNLPPRNDDRRLTDRELLIAARAEIDRVGWGQGHMMNSHGQVCLAGALYCGLMRHHYRLVDRITPWLFYQYHGRKVTEEDFEQIRRVCKRLIVLTELAPQWEARQKVWMTPLTAQELVIRYNDDFDDPEPITRLLDRAIAGCETEELERLIGSECPALPEPEAVLVG